MKKLLISWVDRNSDFIGKKINSEGPNFCFHRHFYSGYDRHILLTNETSYYAEREYSMSLRLYSELRKSFVDHSIELEFMDISENDVINFNAIHSKVYEYLRKLKDMEIDIFISPGSPTMQVVWYFLHQELGQRTRLIQTIQPMHSVTGKQELLEVQIEKSKELYYWYQKEMNEMGQHSNLAINTNDYMITRSLEPVYELVRKIAMTAKTTVLIQGESGTGKEHVARAIHENSNRRNLEFIAVNCGAFTPELLESRLFGHDKGSFTNALKSTEGLFQKADKGTIFLDEIGEISPQMQVFLLRVIQFGEFQRVGSAETKKVDVRIIAATNKDLYEECVKGRFRWDLYYRLSVAEIQVPTLRQRGRREIKEMLEYFVKKIGDSQYNGNHVILSREAMVFLQDYSWPGNIRELENLVESWFAFGVKLVTKDSLPKKFKTDINGIISFRLDDMIRNHIRQVVEYCGGNQSKAKRLLGIGSVNTIKKYIQ